MYTVLFVNGCPYCEATIKMLQDRNIPFKSYDINKIGGFENVHNILSENADAIRFNPSHRTKPIIFYDGKFIGGYTELNNRLSRVMGGSNYYRPTSNYRINRRPY
jgi:glutaredoxin